MDNHKLQVRNFLDPEDLSFNFVTSINLETQDYTVLIDYDYGVRCEKEPKTLLVLSDE